MIDRFRMLLVILCVSLTQTVLAQAQPGGAPDAARPEARSATTLPPPTHADVQYGPHPRNVLDFWQAPSDKPTPLIVYIHGGGFVAGKGGDLLLEMLHFFERQFAAVRTALGR